jgi:hypothetical protein
MAIADLSTYLAKLDSPFQEGVFNRVSGTISNGSSRLHSTWTFAGDTTGVAPTTAAVPTRATAGALGQFNSTGTMRLPRAEIGWSQNGILLLCDRLSHQGGLSGVTTGAQTTNLPTAALTRYTSGEGVWALLEIYTAIGTTATTFTCSYTDQANNSGHTSIAATIGSNGHNQVGRCLVVPLASGDTGVRAVANVNLVATTGTAGNFGVTLVKPLLSLPFQVPNFPQLFDAVRGNILQMPEIAPDACLVWYMIQTSTTTGNIHGVLAYTED